MKVFSRVVGGVVIFITKTSSVHTDPKKEAEKRTIQDGDAIDSRRLAPSQDRPQQVSGPPQSTKSYIKPNLTQHVV